MLLIPVLPLAAALVGYLYRRISLTVAVLLGVAANLAALGICVALFSQKQAVFFASWINLPDNQALMASGSSQSGLEIPLAFMVNPSSLLFVISTAAISIAVLAYAHRERRGDPRGALLVNTLNLFTGAMLLFLTADTLLLIYFAWELMGVCSYLLIAHKGTVEARRAARQAFWTTRTTDFALLFAIIIAMGRYGASLLSQLNIIEIITPLQQYATSIGLDPGSAEFEAMRNTEYAWIGVLLILVLVAVIGKSALLPLSFWLPDAMVAPSPVSALLHAATMVAAGPYLLIQLGGLFVYSQTAMVAATLVGAVSLLLGGAMALCSTDPKRILAYSTVSHMGLVVLGVGTLAAGPAYLHLLAHAWFKAALFIAVGMLVAQHAKQATTANGAGSLKALAGVGNGKLLPTAVLVVAGLSLAGLWGLGGFFGKEHIFSALLFQMGVEVNKDTTLADKYPMAAAAWQISWGMLLISFAITAAYITRLVGVLCFKQAASPTATPATEIAEETGEDAPRTTSWIAANTTLVIVALVGSVGLGVFSWQWFQGVITPVEGSLMWMGPVKYPNMWLLGLLFTLTGGGITYLIRVARPALGDSVASDDSALTWVKGFFGNGMYLREFWGTLVGKTGELLAILSAITDVGVVDALALSTGDVGRSLAQGSAWLDKHFIDGVRYRVCGICWQAKELHGRYLQTGRIQRYMLIVAISAAVLCLIIVKPLGERFAPFLENLMQEGVI